MLLRGYHGGYQYLSGQIVFRTTDFVYLLFWAGVFLLFRMCPVVLLAGNLFGGF